jgi:hypothetical protein
MVTTTLRQLYQDESKDPCRGDYARIMMRFNIMIANPVPGPTLFQQVVNRWGGVLQSFLCCGRSLNGPRVFALHLPSKFLAPLDCTPSVWDDRSFAFKGDVVQGMVSIVNFPDEAFEVTTQRVKTLEYMLRKQAELEDLPIFPSVSAQENESKEITTRRFIFLPAAFALLLIRSTGYTLKEVWDLVYPAMQQ